MKIVEAVKRYFHGDDKENKVLAFEKFDNDINTYRKGISDMTEELSTLTKNVDVVNKASNDIINEGGTVEHVNIALDNIKFSHASLSNYMSNFTFKINELKSSLNKAESGMVRLIEENPNIAEIICNTKHDESIEKSFADVLVLYKDGNIDKSAVLSAYKGAKSKLRTDRNLSVLFDSYLKDI